MNHFDVALNLASNLKGYVDLEMKGNWFGFIVNYMLS